jgi:hypothetical protein
MNRTFGQLRKEIVLQIWPSGAPENLLDRNPEFPNVPSAIEQLFQEAAGDIAKWSKCEQQNNVNIVNFNKTAYKVGMTILKAPRGAISRVFTVTNADYNNPIFYRQVEWPLPETWSRHIAQSGVTVVGFPRLPLGYMPADASTDSLCGRSRVGIWCIHQGNIFIAPWIQSTERVVIEWNGIKEFWMDDDIVTNEAQDYRKALMLYVQYAFERMYGSLEKAAVYLVRRPGMTDTGLYADALADLMWQCDQETKVRETPHYNNERKTFVDEQLQAASSSTTVENEFIGQFEIPAGATGGTITGLNLGFIPRMVRIDAVTIPVNGIVMFANDVSGTLSADGFSFALSGITDSEGYVLKYEIS